MPDGTGRADAGTRRRRTGRSGQREESVVVSEDGVVGDATRPVRDEDAFDVAAVDGWLRTALAGTADGAEVAPGVLGSERAALPPGLPVVRQFPGGASNLTYLLRYGPLGAGSGAAPGSGSDGVRELVLRRPPHGARGGSAHDMGREFALQAALRPVFPLVPAMVVHGTDTALLGAEFYVMERLSGTILRSDVPPELAAALAPEAVDDLCGRAVDVLGALHDVDVAAAGLDRFGRGGDSVARQVAGWTRRYAAARTPDVPDFEEVTAWLEAERPADVGSCLVHNDFRFDNLVLHGDPRAGRPFEVAGVLDWELATVGDPLCELGSALAYWVQADDEPAFRASRRQPTHLPGMWTRRQVVEGYAARRGLAVDAGSWRFYEVFGLFRLAVIAQQIWARFVTGATTNPAFAALGPMVGLLEQRCRQVVEHGPVGWDA
ncbi:phosphotransferase family protein [Nocardioides sp. ChNu-99]|nr:phosphotransferase family protein [Nocardioides sp. ChNu-99]